MKGVRKGFIYSKSISGLTQASVIDIDKVHPYIV